MVWDLETHPENYDTIYSSHVSTVIVWNGMDIDQRLMLIAAAKTVEMGGRSVDYVLKRYGEIWKAQIEKGETSLSS